MNLHIFENDQFGRVRTLVEEDGIILFCGNDVACALGYRNPSRDVQRHCKRAVERCTTDSVGRQQQMLFIPQSDIYRLIIRSKLPAAVEFENWVVETVLPTIRKHGAYITPQTLEQLLSNPDASTKLFHELKEVETKLADLQPKADYYTALVDTHVLTTIRQTAKELRIPEKLFTYLLVDMGFAYRTSKKLLMPYAFMVTSGFAELKEYTTGKHGGVYMLFTPVGRLYLMKKMHKRLGIKSQALTTKE